MKDVFCICFVLALLVGLILFGIYAISERCRMINPPPDEEINTVEVGLIVGMERKEPKLCPAIYQAAKDGKITRSEYEYIQKERLSIIRASFMEELKGGDKSKYQAVKQ